MHACPHHCVSQLGAPSHGSPRHSRLDTTNLHTTNLRKYRSRLDARLVTPYLASGVTVTIVTSAIYTYVSATGVLESKGRALV